MQDGVVTLFRRLKHCDGRGPESRGSNTGETPDSALDPTRRRLSAALILVTVAAPFALASRGRAAGPVIEVWTGPSCSCCHDWIAHLESSGFEVVAHDGGNSQARARLGMPVRYGSCHSGAVEGFAIEGHVPASEIRRLLAERPDAVGLSVPAMPRGAPGMDGAIYDGVQDPFDVLLIAQDGSAQIYRSYR